MSTYGFFGHTSPINTPTGSDRDGVNPALSSFVELENIQQGFPVPLAVYQYLYMDTSSAWAHRDAILNSHENWVGIGIVSNPNAQSPFYTTDDFINSSGAIYTPPATADTGTPLMGAITSSGGTATVTGVADSPQNVNDQGANPTTAGITSVVFYTNNISASDTGPTPSFNIVQATQTPPGSGTWTAPIMVNPGDVLHAVATDGSGNFTDATMNPPAVTLNAGANSLALPAATGTNGVMMRGSTATTAGLEVTHSAAGLASSIDDQLGASAVRDVQVFVDGHWLTYRPGTNSPNFPLYTSEGVVVGVSRHGSWEPPASDELLAAPSIRLQKGWNFVAAPYPIVHLTCHAIRLELARDGVTLQQITVGTSPTQGRIMRPNSAGQWGNDLRQVLSDQTGFWVKTTGATTWVPNATQYRSVSARLG